ncbi:hypothetical protein HDE_14039 [Halotydeus destructor]|nr:hypothetical protein HDE_14039 [Halotydeus destructor]
MFRRRHRRERRKYSRDGADKQFRDSPPIEDVLNEILNERNDLDGHLDDDYIGDTDDLFSVPASSKNSEDSQMKSTLSKSTFSSSNSTYSRTSNLITLTGNVPEPIINNEEEEEDEESATQRRGKFTSERMMSTVRLSASNRDIPDSLDKVVIDPSQNGSGKPNLRKPLSKPSVLISPRKESFRTGSYSSQNTESPKQAHWAAKIHVNPRFRHQLTESFSGNGGQRPALLVPPTRSSVPVQQVLNYHERQQQPFHENPFPNHHQSYQQQKYNHNPQHNNSDIPRNQPSHHYPYNAHVTQNVRPEMTRPFFDSSVPTHVHNQNFSHSQGPNQNNVYRQNDHIQRPPLIQGSPPRHLAGPHQGHYHPSNQEQWQAPGNFVAHNIGHHARPEAPYHPNGPNMNLGLRFPQDGMNHPRFEQVGYNSCPPPGFRGPMVGQRQPLIPNRPLLQHPPQIRPLDHFSQQPRLQDNHGFRHPNQPQVNHPIHYSHSNQPMALNQNPMVHQQQNVQGNSWRPAGAHNAVPLSPPRLRALLPTPRLPGRPSGLNPNANEFVPLDSIRAPGLPFKRRVSETGSVELHKQKMQRIGNSKNMSNRPVFAGSRHSSLRTVAQQRVAKSKIILAKKQQVSKGHPNVKQVTLVDVPKAEVASKKQSPEVIAGISVDDEYKRKLEEQKKMRDEIIRKKEARRKEMALKKTANA